MRNLLINILLLFVIFPSFALENSFDLSFSHINKGDGLSDDMVFSIFQDSSGYIWIGTSNGLNRYDGYNITNFFHKPDSPHSLAHNTVTSICEDSENNIWFGTFGGGISRFIPATNSFRNYTFSKQTSDPGSAKLINHIQSDSKNRFWVSTRGAGVFLFEYKTNKIKNFNKISTVRNEEALNNVMSTFEDSNGTIWIAAWGGGLGKYIEENGIIEKASPNEFRDTPKRGKFIHTILEDAENNLWLGTRDEGIIRFDRRSGIYRTFGLEKNRIINMTGKSINFIFSDPDNHNLIWIGTVNGLYIYKIAENKFISYISKDLHSGLSNNYIWSIIRDRSGLLWAGTIGNGINLEKRVRDYFRSFNTTGPDGYSLSSNVISSLYSDEKNPESLWVGTIGGGLNRINLKSGKINSYISSIREVRSIAPRYINSIISDPESPGFLYLGTSSGLNKYDITRNNFIKITSPVKNFEGFNSVLIQDLMYSNSHKGYLWLGTYGEGLFKMDLSDFSLQNYIFETKIKNNSEKNRVYTIKQSLSNSNILWVGTNFGLGKFDTEKETFRFFKIPAAYDTAQRTLAQSLYESGSEPGILWIGTWGKGMFRFDENTETFTQFTENQGLPNNYIVSIVEEPVGRLWIGTQSGLSSYIKNSGFFRNFNNFEGLQNSLFRLNASFKNSDKTIFLGGSKGIDYFSPDKLNTNILPPPVVLTGIKIFGSTELPGMEEILSTDISVADQIKLPYKYNTVTISFSALDFTSPGKNQYACKIVELEDEWEYLGTQNYITYTNLKPGKYTFKVKGSNSDSVWNEKGRTLNIIINSSFTRTLLYKIIYAIILIILVSLILYLWRKLRQISFSPGITMEKLISKNDITEREAEIIKLIIMGKSNKEIEEELFISLGTVKNHLYHIYRKLNINSRTQLINLLSTKDRK